MHTCVYVSIYYVHVSFQEKSCFYICCSFCLTFNQQFELLLEKNKLSDCESASNTHALNSREIQHFQGSPLV